MKKYFLCSAIVAFATSAVAGASDLDIPQKVIDAFNENPQCARIVETGQEIDFISSNGIVAGKNGSEWIRFITFKRTLPMKANAVTSGSRKVVNLVACEKSVTELTQPIIAQKSDAVSDDVVAGGVDIEKPSEEQFADVAAMTVPTNSRQKSFYQPLGVEPDAEELADDAKKNGVSVRGLFCTFKEIMRHQSPDKTPQQE